MKNLYLTTAMILSFGGAAFAQTATAPAADAPAAEAPAAEAPAAEAPAAPAADATAAAPAADAAASTPAGAMETGLLRASALEGVDVYTVDVTGQTTWDDATAYTEIDANWEKIGEVEDLVLDGEGNVVGAIAEVGGFLGLGEKEVVLKPEEVAYVVTDDKIAVVSGLSKEALEQREEIAEDMLKGE